MKYVIDLQKVKDIESLHQTIRETLQFPDYYGANLDALHDMLEEMSEDTVIYFQSCGAFQRREPEYMKALKQVCRESNFKIRFWRYNRF